METNSEILLTAVQNNEFDDFFLGLNEYKSNEEYNPTLISYRNNLTALYEVYSETKNMRYIKLFEDFIERACESVEGVYISVIYLNLLAYHKRDGICIDEIDFYKLKEIVSNAVSQQVTSLKSTNGLERLCVDGVLYDKIAFLNLNCYHNTGDFLFNQ